MWTVRRLAQQNENWWFLILELQYQYISVGAGSKYVKYENRISIIAQPPKAHCYSPKVVKVWNKVTSTTVTTTDQTSHKLPFKIISFYSVKESEIPRSINCGFHNQELRFWQRSAHTVPLTLDCRTWPFWPTRGPQFKKCIRPQGACKDPDLTCSEGSSGNMSSLHKAKNNICSH